VLRKAGDRLYVVPVRIQDAIRGDMARLGPQDLPRLESGDTLVIP
jgi:hypothetical protein